MSVKFALLGLLAHTPRHGYDLMQDYEASFSQMRKINPGQIYTTLARLTAENPPLVTSETIEQNNAPAKKVYRLTEAGRQALNEWLAKPVEDSFEQVHSEFFSKLLVSALVAGPQNQQDAPWLGMIERQRAQLEQNLEHLRKQRRQLTLLLPPGSADPRPPAEQELGELRLLLLEGAILHLEADLTWLNLIQNRLSRLAQLREQETAAQD